MAVIGVACVAAADSSARQGVPGTQPLWWLGLLAIFAPAAATLLLAKVSRSEAAFILLVTGIALYGVKLVYAPGRLWEFDELLHYPTVDALLTTHRLFTPNSLLPVSPYYPGMETVTAVIVQLTGLNIVQAGLVLIGIARTLTVVSLFLLFERIALPPRFAASAALLYMACPAFFYFDSQFAYESLAIALSFACLFTLRAAQLEQGRHRRRLNYMATLLLLAVVVTHHITSLILVATLVAWTLSELFAVLRARAKACEGLWFDSETDQPLVYLVDLPGGTWVPVLGVVALLAWLLNIASVTISYLGPQLISGLAEFVRIIRLEETGRTLFQSNAGHTASILERSLGIGSVLIILALIPLGIRYLWNRRDALVLSRFLAIGSLAYPATLALRLTRSGWEIGSRATAFAYIPLAFTIAAGLHVVMTRHVRHVALRAVSVVAVASLVFVGGIVAVTSPTTRQPAPYNPGLAWVPYDVESLAAAQWAATTLGPGHRFAADSAGGSLLGSIGRQEPVASQGDVSISQLFLTPTFDLSDQTIVRDGRIGYIMVDRRIVGAEPLKGYIYEKWERQVRSYGSSVSSETVNKFSLLRDANKVFDSGNVQFFDVHRLVQ